MSSSGFKTPIVLVGILGLGMSIHTLITLRKFEEHEQSLLVREYSFKVAHEIQEEIDNSINILRAIDGLFLASRNIDRDEFQAFCKRVLTADHPIQLIEWQPRVPAKLKRKFEADAQKDGLTNFSFFEIDRNNKKIPARERLYHYPVYFSHSNNPELIRLGLDLAIFKERMQAKMKAMRTGLPSASETFKVLLANSKKSHSALAINLPVYKKRIVSSEEREKVLRGFIVSVLYVDELAKEILAKKDYRNFSLEIHDLVNGKKSPIKSFNHEKPLVNWPVVGVPIDIADRTWVITLTPNLDFMEGKRSYMPWLIFFLLITITLAAICYLALRMKSRSKLRKYEHQIQQKQRLESLGHLASGIAHEFNNILQTLYLCIDGIKSSDSPKTRAYHIQIAESYCDKASQLIRQILSFARHDGGVLQDIYPSKEIQESIKLAKNILPKTIDLELQIEEDQFPMSMNVNHIGQIIINLCTNAAYAMNNEGTVKISYTIQDNRRVLSVSDSGHGMSKEVIEHIFDPFYTTKPVNEGTGLGLSVVYGIVQSYGGTIEVDSVPDEGSTFRVILPG